MRDRSDRGWTIVDVLKDRLGSLNVPVPGGMDSGHDLLDQTGNSNFSAIPLGSVATLNTASRRAEQSQKDFGFFWPL